MEGAGEMRIRRADRTNQWWDPKYNAGGRGRMGKKGEKSFSAGV